MLNGAQPKAHPGAPLLPLVIACLRKPDKSCALFNFKKQRTVFNYNRLGGIHLK